MHLTAVHVLASIRRRIWLASLDLVQREYIELGTDGHGGVVLDAMEITMKLEYAPRIIDCSWTTFDEGDEMAGSSSAHFDDDDHLEYAFTMVTKLAQKA